MKPLDRYGPTLVEYEGVADLTFPQESKSVYKGHFQATQLKAGGIVIRFVPTTHESDGTSIIDELFYSKPLVHGRDTDGWEITTCGQTLELTTLSPLDAPVGSTHPARTFSSQCIRAKSNEVSESGYEQARFRVANLLWHDRNEIPETFRVDTGDFVVTVSPSDDYLDAVDSIKAVRGIAPTAEVLIKTSDDSRLSLGCYVNFMNDFVSVFRLATGNKVDWYYGEAFEVGTERAVERFHKDAITGPFSKTVRFRGLRSGMVSSVPKLNFEALAESFFDDDKQVLDQDTLKKLINYFINACDETSYLEARGLLASTLLDLIVLKYTKTKKAHNIMGEEEFESQVLPILTKAIETVSLPESSKDLRKRAIDQLSGGFRRSFKRRLDLLTKELNLPLDNKARRRAVDIRNKLVHDGTYLSTNESGEWYSQYRFMIWIDLVALCRLTGYEDDLPLLAEGRRLEV